MKTNKLLVGTQALAVCVMLGLTSCKDGNLFGGLNDRGHSSNTETLVTQGNVALHERNFSEALNIFQNALNRDPNNAEALYGAAAAAIGTAGISLGTIVANVTRQTSSMSANNTSATNLVDLVQNARIGSAGSPAPAPASDSLLYGINLVQLDSVLDTAICRLQKIASGTSDNKISPNDVDVLVNLGVLCALRAALRPINADFLDITNNAGTFSIVKKADFDSPTFCADNAAMIKLMAKDIVAAYACFNKAADVLGLSGDKIIIRIKEDIDNAVQILLAARTGNNLPASCIAIIGTSPDPDITASNYQSKRDIFNPPSGC